MCAPFFKSEKGLVGLFLFFTFSAFLTFQLEAQTYKILPLGNSITEGKDLHPGYRYPLYDKLTDAYIDFEFVGTKTSVSRQSDRQAPCMEGPRTIPPLQHEGHGGWRADELLNGKPNPDLGKLSVWLQEYTPDVALVHAGTNDIIQGRSVSHVLTQLRGIVGVLRDDNPKIIILLAQLTPMDPNSYGEDKAARLKELNKAIPGLVRELHTTSSPVLVVDQETGYNPERDQDTHDGLHANARGAHKMADKWMGVLQTVLKSYTELPTVSLTAPANGASAGVGQPLTLSASAQDPEGAVKGVEFYANCQKIGEDSSAPYSMSWTPSQTGKYSLLARVTDAAGAKALSTPVEITVGQDGGTEPPVLYKPAANSESNGPVEIEFSLPEAAKAGSVSLTFKRISGAADANAPHVVRLKAAYEGADRHSLVLDGNDLSTHQGVASVSSGAQDALVSGAVYSVTLSYQDAAGNAAASATKTGIAFTLSSPPPRPAKPRLAAESDTGISNSDGITSNATPQLQGSTEANAQLAVYADNALLGTTTASGSGGWSYIIPSNKALAEGSRNIKVIASNAAGQQSPESEVLTIIIDLQPPVVRTKDKTLQLNAAGRATIGPEDLDGGSTDNYSSGSGLRHTLSRSSFSCTESGKDVPVTLSVADEAGNTASAAATVKVVDALAPELQVKDVSLWLDATGKASLLASDAIVSSSDNCGTTAISFSRSDFICQDAGKTIDVLVTATDTGGNKTERGIKVSIKDGTVPVARTKNIRIELDAEGKAGISAASVNNGSSDNCSIVALSLDKEQFACADVGDNPVILTIKDAAGNAASARAIVTVTDPFAPAIPAAQLFELDEHTAAGTSAGQVSATDNCGISSWKIESGNAENAFAISPEGVLRVNNAAALDYEARTEFVLTIGVADAAANKASQTITIKLKNLNDTPPQLSLPAEVSGNELEPISFKASASDADGSTTFQFSLQGEVPEGAAINAADGVFNWTPAEDQDGEYTLTIAVSDGANSSQKSITVRVLEVNQPPRITSTPVLEAQAGESYVYTLVATDEDLPANTLNYSAQTLPGWLTFNSTSGELSGMPDEEAVGEHAIVLRVSDGTAEVAQEYVLTVAAPTGIADPEKTGVLLYPNPSGAAITLEIKDFPAGEQAGASLLSSNGKVIFQTRGTPDQISAALSTYLGNASAGMYVLQLVWQEKRTTQKIIRH